MKQVLTFLAVLAATPAVAQPVRPVRPVPPVAPVAPLPPLPKMPAVAPTPPMPPMPPMEPKFEFHEYGKFRLNGQDMQERAMELQQRAQQRAQERAMEAQERAMERARESQQRAQERAMEQAMQGQQRAQEAQQRAMEQAMQGQQRAQEAQQRAMERAQEAQERAMNRSFESFGPRGLMVTPFAAHYSLPEMPPQAWAQSDPADSMYRAARATLERGDYRKAAAGFKEIPQKFQYSVYAADAMYWQSYSLYRIGSTPELQEALAVLDALKQKYPSSRNKERSDVAQLSARIAGVLSTRGLGNQEAVKRALTEAGGNTCDSEEQSVRAQALSALMETDPDAAAQLAQKMLAKKDECSVQLRRNAVMIASRKRDAQTLSTLTNVAKSDPSSEVRQSAVRYLASMPGDDALSALEELLKSSDDVNVQREAVNALARHSSPRARQVARVIIERNDAQESLRLSALRGFDRDRSTTEDATWLRNVYPKIDNPRVKSEIVQAITRIGGDGMDTWFLTLAKNENESIEARNSAIRKAAQTMDIPTLGKLYEQLAVKRLRSSIIDALASRREPETIDRLMEIAKNGTDPDLRSQAINALTRKDDPRARKALLDLIDK